MSKRNFILLIIILGVALAITLGFLYFREEPAAPGDVGPGTNFFSQFNPFGNSRPSPPPEKPPADISGYMPPEIDTSGMLLRKVSSMPVAGYGIFTKERIKEVPTSVLEIDTETLPVGGTAVKKPVTPKTEFVTAVRYVEKAKGLIYQTFADKLEEKKFSATIIPKIYDAYFGNKAESVIMRYLKTDNKTIETFAGTLPKEYLGDISGNKEIKGYFLPNNIKDISVSPDSLKIFYLFMNGSSEDSIVGTVLNLANNSKVQVFDSLFTDWLAQWGSSNIITLTSKPSSGTPGYAYSLDVAKKSLIKILGEVNGLTTLTSPNGKLILYSDGGASTYLHHTDTRTSDLLGIKTLPEKCVWGRISDIAYCAVPKSIGLGRYPDTWYQGEVSFNDQLWKIDIKTGNATLIIDPAGSGEEIDGTRLALDEGENYLFFINKKDSFLWRLDLK